MKTWLRILPLPLLLAGCTSTHTMRNVETSGFLANYEQIQKHPDWEANRVYVAPDADFSKYDRILVEPIVVMAAPKSNLGKLSDEKLQPLLDYFEASLRKEIGPVYILAEEPGTSTATIKVALTDAHASVILRDITSNVLPYGIAFSTLKKTTFGIHTGVGHAQAEIEVVDSVTGELIAAAIDARAGRKWFEGKFDRWDDVKDACDDWSANIRDALQKGKHK